jgi:hypothetical protein
MEAKLKKIYWKGDKYWDCHNKPIQQIGRKSGLPVNFVLCEKTDFRNALCLALW